jgi:hypothetical protein
MRRERQANEQFLRFALAYRSGGTAFDRLPESLRQDVTESLEECTPQAGFFELYRPQFYSSLAALTALLRWCWL